jgi:archaellum biogenesis ATPase FlaH
VVVSRKFDDYSEWYYEIAVGDYTNRGIFIRYQDLDEYVFEHGEEKGIHRSIYLFPHTAIEQLRKKRSSKTYLDEVWVGTIPIDIDIDKNTDEYVLAKAREVVEKFYSLGLKEHNLAIYYSGRGYHLEIPNSVFGFQPSDDLPQRLGKTIEHIYADLDMMPYIRNHMIRCENTINSKSGLYKVRLSHTELFDLDVSDIKSIAKERRFIGFIPEGDLELHKITKRFDIAQPYGIKSFQTVRPNHGAFPCFQKLYNDGPMEGTRHQAILHLCGHWNYHGITPEGAKAMMLYWNTLNKGVPSLPPNDVLYQVEYCFNQGYNYGCGSPLLKSKCHSTCIHFTNKDYNPSLMTSSDAQSALKFRAETDFTGRSIDLGERFAGKGIVDCEMYPGSLVVLFGPTGSNKTTLAALIALGYDFENDVFRPEWQVNTIYATLELKAWIMHRRNLQMLSELPKEEVNRRRDQLFQIYEPSLQHIQFIETSVSLDAIEKLIMSTNAPFIVLDYIDQITAQGFTGETKIHHIMHSLRQIVQKRNTIILLLSQITKDISRAKILDLYSGRGSGSIEHSANLVIGINNPIDGSPERIVEVYKNTDGELFKSRLTWTPSFRLKKLANMK